MLWQDIGELAFREVSDADIIDTIELLLDLEMD